LRLRKDEALALLRPELHHYLDERIQMTGWYPEDDHVEMIRVQAKLLGPEGCAVMGRDLAHIEFEGVYKAQLHEGDPLRTLQGFSAFWQRHHDTGRVEVAHHGDVVTLTLSDYVVAREICDIITRYLEEAVRMAGGSAKVTHVRCRALHAHSCVW